MNFVSKALLGCSLIATIMSSCVKDPRTFYGGNGDSTNHHHDSTDTCSSHHAKLYVCGGYTLVQSATGEYSCPTGTGCAKISNQACAVPIQHPGSGRDVLFVRSDYDDFQAARQCGQLRAFFKSDKWQSVFPDLFNNSSLLEKLQKGKATVIQQTNSAGSIFELVILANSRTGKCDNASQVLLALEIPKCFL